MKYIVSYSNPDSHYIDIQIHVEVRASNKMNFQLPAWRPGRYELGNFAKNIQKFSAFNENGQTLAFVKTTKDLWEVSCENCKVVTIQYNYFANELNAGSTFLDRNQLYMNPVNCMMYEVGQAANECELHLELPNDYRVAIALPEVRSNVFRANNFDELADSPFIASASMQHHEFKVSDTSFHLWFQGEFKPDWDVLEKDFIGFTKPQIDLFGDFPTKEYHYLFQVLPHSAYHGVEHCASTVIMIGPSYNVLKKEGRYEDLLGVSSHELFHTWNVKRIRPIEMQPYDFSKENYSKLGYLSEGATTWYGDVMLYRGRVFDDAAFFRTFNQILERHYNNPGSSNMSVADSSFDTWLDGYVLGVPNRKASIYTEGALNTFMLDVEIRKGSGGNHSFDSVLKTFYQDYFKKGRGISEEAYQTEVEKYAGKELKDFFSKYINGAEDYTAQLNEALDFFGLEMKRMPSPVFYEAYFGVKMIENKVAMVFPNSPAENGGVSVNDEIVIVNGYKINNDLSEWLEYFKEETVSLGAFDQHGSAKRIQVNLTGDYYFSKYEVSWKTELTKEQEENRKAWRGY